MIKVLILQYVVLHAIEAKFQHYLIYVSQFKSCQTMWVKQKMYYFILMLGNAHAN